jgi:hypothetical protein
MVGINLESDYLTRDNVILDSEIFLCELVDITDLVRNCSDKECTLYHDKIICDYVMHLFKKFKNVFEEVDYILIERQPIMGIVSVQELIMREYRNKSRLISPNAMLKFYGILHFDYSKRKECTEEIANKYLSGIKMFVFNERKHDMADAFCIIYYFVSMLRTNHKIKQEKIDFRTNNQHFFKTIEEFIYSEDNSEE